MAYIGVLGGSFDPVHNSHLEMANCAVEEFGLDLVIFLPAYLPPHKNKLDASSCDRLNMLVLALDDKSNFVIDKFEINSRKVIYTYQTLDYLRQKYCADKISLLIGSDTFNELDTWRKPDYIAEKYGFIVMRRPNIAINQENKYSKYAVFSKVLIKDISSTVIRDFLAGDKKDIEKKNLVPEKVLEYIVKRGLYGNA